MSVNAISPRILRGEPFISREAAEAAVCASADEFIARNGRPARALLLPPDYTRLYSGAGMLCAMVYRHLTEAGVDAYVMPALGTHRPMSETEIASFFEGAVPSDKILVHNWRTDVVKLGEVPADFVSSVSDGLVSEGIDVEVNRRLVSGEYGLIVSLGQIVPHEVVGMAGYSKNIFVGCGGASMINHSHMLGAFYGMERIMGRDFSPVRRVFDYAEERFIAGVPLIYALTVCTGEGGKTGLRGLYLGRSRALFEAAVADSQKYNVNYVSEPFDHVVVYLDPREFKSTWLGNKAVYRTRMAIADGGTLTVLAPGVRRFGEDDANDRLIRRYGYAGREKVLELVKTHADLRENLSVAAHLIHGSSDGRFRITYCAGGLSEAEVHGVNFDYAPCGEAMGKYDPSELRDGFCEVRGERIFYVSNPALGLWIYDKEKAERGKTI